jgi:hypothetical protein
VPDRQQQVMPNLQGKLRCPVSHFSPFCVPGLCTVGKAINTTPLGPPALDRQRRAGDRHLDIGTRSPLLDGTRHLGFCPPARAISPLALATLVLGSRWVLHSLLRNQSLAVLTFRSGDQRLIRRDAKPKAEPSAAERNSSRPTGR